MEKNIGASQLDPEVRKGPWTMEEDLILINHIANHGQGVWNDLARSAGLKRTGKSCRLRWLNYLRPDVRRGNITPEEHMLIVELHSRWGNRWSKIAKQIPGRTDNEIKNFWRTRIQKKKKKKEGISFEGYSSEAPIDHRRPEEEEEASASFVGGGGSSITMEDGGMELCSPSINTSDGQDALMATESPPGLGDGFWAVDDLWSMQF